MITLRGSTSGALQTSFQVVGVKTSFGVYPFRVNPFSSIYSDSSNMDFMIATVDGIDGPLNKMKFNNYFLINGFTFSTPTNTINMGFVNFKSSALDGSQVPTMLRIKGTISNNASALNSLVVFFDQLTPFFSNMQSGEIYCQNTDNTYPCRYYKGDNTLTNRVYNYNSLSRFEVSLLTPSTSFSILIPVTGYTSSTNFYVAYQTTNAITSFKSLAYVEPKRTITLTSVTASTTSTTGLTVSTYSVGQTVTSLSIKANNGGTVNTNSANNIGSAFSYFSQWNYFSGSTITGFSTYGTCYKLSYLYYYTNYALYLTGTTFSSFYYLMTGIVCSCDLSGSISTATLTASSVTLPANWGLNLPGYGAISDYDGSLKFINSNINYQKIGSSLTVSNITFPPVGPSMTKSVGSWVIPLPVGLDSSVLITISGGSSNLPFTFVNFGDSLTTCSVYYNSIVQPITCTWTSSLPTSISYTLTILESGLLPSGSGFSLVHYGMTSNSSYNSVTVSLTCYSLLNTLTPGVNDVIFSASSVVFPYNGANYIGPSSLNLGSFTQWTQNKGVV